ncbi:flippase [Thalassobacillus hwangdonensis]|uniref:Flippase n=1 Tax=Thalassobacillus hwangdonensis TaxID=546108 RepID=A0ABW3L4G6_9BACI
MRQVEKHLNKMAKNHFLKKITESFFGRMSYMIFSLVFTLICARLYGPELFGEFTFAFTLMQVLMVIATLGFNNGVIYSIPKDGSKYISLSLFMNALASIALMLIVSFFLEDSTILLALPLIWLLSMEQIFFGIYKSEEKIKQYYSINGLYHMVLRIGLLVFFYFLIGKDILSILLSVVLAYIFSNMLYIKRFLHLIKEVNYNSIYVRYSITLILASIMATLLNRTDILMLQWLRDSRSVGIYQVTVQVTNLLSSLLLIFNTVFAPEISRLFHSNRLEEMKDLYIKATRILALVSFSATLLIIVSSNFLLMIFGEEFQSGQGALILRSLGYFINLSVGGVWLMLSMTGAPRFQMYTNIFAFLLNVILNIVLIPPLGLLGAAIATMVTMAIANIIGYYIVSRRFNIKVFKYF